VLVVAEPAVNHGQGGLFDALSDGVDLDGMGEVIGEIDDHSQAGKQQHDGPADRESREVLGAATGGQADRVQARRGVGERRDECAEDNLIGPVSQEVP